MADGANGMTKEAVLCPACGADEPLRIAYGLPSRDMVQACERGEIALGGCVIEDTSPTRRCRSCGHAWGGPPTKIDGFAAVIQERPQ